jgi:hypothetical protein
MLYEKNQVGVRESLADLIANVEAQATPFTSMAAKRKKPNNKIHDWQVKAYPVTGHKGVMDGKDADDFSHNPRERIHGVAQKTWNNPAVSDFAEESEVAGEAKGEMAAQIADSLVTVKRQIERRCLSDAECSVDNGTNVPNETRGIFKWVDNAAQTLYPVPEKFRTPTGCIYSGALTSFTEADFIALMANGYKLRKSPSKLDGFVGVDLKTKFTDFSVYVTDQSGSTPIRQFNQDAAKKAVIRCINRLEFDTGTVDLHLSSFLLTNEENGEDGASTHKSGIFLDMSMVGLAYTRMPRVVKLEYKGGGYKAIVDAIFMLMLDNPLGHLKVVGT